MEGLLEKVIYIPARSTEEVALHAAIEEGSILKAGWQFLTDKKGTGFIYEFSGELMSENKMFDNTTTKILAEGVLDDF